MALLFRQMKSNINSMYYVLEYKDQKWLHPKRLMGKNMQTQDKGIVHLKILLAVAIDFYGMEKIPSTVNCFVL